ncbi:MAG: hypothetical protein IH607_00460 [Firmicutes bacterium]|nr:hypothetical protein [Bacillota bacterium]
MRIAIKLKPVETLLKKRGIDSGGAVQRYIDSEVLRLCRPYVPLDQGTLIASGRLATTLGSGEVKYNTPYARKWYYQPAHFSGAPTRGNHWFERMKNEGGKAEILRGVKQLTGVK